MGGRKRPRNLGAEGGVTPATDEEAVFQLRSSDPFFEGKYSAVT